MAQRNEKVFERVRQELSKNPDLGSRELYDLAQGVDKAIAQDTLQQFHARYVLPVKRERAREGGRGGRRAGGTAAGGRRGQRGAAAATATAESAGQPAQAASGQRRGRRASSTGGPGAGQGGTASRDQVRSVLLQFAQELTDAESRSSLVKVLSRVDSYVDRIVANGG